MKTRIADRRAVEAGANKVQSLNRSQSYSTLSYYCFSLKAGHIYASTIHVRVVRDFIS